MRSTQLRRYSAAWRAGGRTLSSPSKSVAEIVAHMMARDPERLRPMISHRLPLGRGLEGFELARQRAASKVMLQP